MKRVIVRFCRNYEGFWPVYWWMVAIFCLALLCDGASTVHFMLHTGSEAELHPVVALTSKILGPVLGPILGVVAKALCGILVAIYWRRIAFYLFFTASIISFWAGWYNIWGANLYVPRFLKWLMF